MNSSIRISCSFIKLIVTISVFLWSGNSTFAQSDSCEFYFDKNLKDTVYTFVTNPPVFGEEKDELIKYLINNIKVERDEIESYSDKIFISITIDKNGGMIESKVIRGGNDRINKKIIEKINEMKEWTPASCNERNVNYKLTVPIYIHFKK